MSELPEEIFAEKEHIEKTLEVMREALERKRKTFVELTAVASSLHHCYSGMENIIKRMLKSRKIMIPSSPSSHKDLLILAAAEGFVSDDLLNKLDKFRGFRHFYVHGYGIMLDKNALLPLANELPGVWRRFLAEIDIFLQSSENL